MKISFILILLLAVTTSFAMASGPMGCQDNSIQKKQILGQLDDFTYLHALELACESYQQAQSRSSNYQSYLNESSVIEARFYKPYMSIIRNKLKAYSINNKDLVINFDDSDLDHTNFKTVESAAKLIFNFVSTNI